MELKADLFPRYKNDGEIPWKMNEIQLKFREKVLKKINNDIYILEDVKACLCGSQEWVCISERDRHNLPMGTVICKKCGLIRTTPRISEHSLAQFYNEDYLGLNFGIIDIKPEQALFNAKQGEIIYKFIKPYLSRFQSNISICEVGAATGRNLLGFSIKANKDGIRTTLIGCDYAESSVVAGRKNNIDFYLGDAATLVKNGLKCDLLILSHVLEHFVDIKFHLDCIRRLLNENGLLYIEVPGVMDLKNRYGCDYAKYVTGAHIYHFNRTTLVYYVEQEGFHCIYADEYSRGVFEINGNRETGIDLSNNYDTTLHYLSDLYDNKEYYVSLAKGNLIYRLAMKMVLSQLKPLLKRIIQK